MRQTGVRIYWAKRSRLSEHDCGRVNAENYNVPRLFDIIAKKQIRRTRFAKELCAYMVSGVMRKIEWHLQSYYAPLQTTPFAAISRSVPPLLLTHSRARRPEDRYSLSAGDRPMVTMNTNRVARLSLTGRDPAAEYWACAPDLPTRPVESKDPGDDRGVALLQK